MNKVILIGNLGADPESKFTPSGAQVVNCSLATNESWTDKAGEKQERTEWHRLVMWNKLAETVSVHARKGSTLAVEGEIRTRSWETQDGEKRYSTEINVRNFEFVGKRADSDMPAKETAAPEDTRGVSDDDDLPF